MSRDISRLGRVLSIVGDGVGYLTHSSVELLHGGLLLHSRLGERFRVAGHLLGVVRNVLARALKLLYNTRHGVHDIAQRLLYWNEIAHILRLGGYAEVFPRDLFCGVVDISDNILYVTRHGVYRLGKLQQLVVRVDGNAAARKVALRHIDYLSADYLNGLYDTLSYPHYNKGAYHERHQNNAEKNKGYGIGGNKEFARVYSGKHSPAVRTLYKLCSVAHIRAVYSLIIKNSHRACGGSDELLVLAAAYAVLYRVNALRGNDSAVGVDYRHVAELICLKRRESAAQPLTVQLRRQYYVARLYRIIERYPAVGIYRG